jgi:Trk K+ transport system NAD-binding subunit
VLEVTLRNHTLVGKRLRDIRLPHNCLILLIRRDGELVTPRGTTVLQDWDSLTLAGDRDSVLETAQLLQSRRGE